MMEAPQQLTPSWLIIGLLALLLVVTLLLLITIIAWRRARTRTGRANLARHRVAQRAESEAERLLERFGFTILERQLSRRFTLEIDGTPQAVHCRADLLVSRGRRLYVADVKSGAQAPNPRHPATRRQLLEYLLVFAADGTLLVDMQRREIHTVSFPALQHPS